MKLLLTIALLFTFQTQADTFDKQFNESMRGGACKKLNLTPEQRASLKEKLIAWKHQMIDLKAAMKHARLDFRVAIMSDDATVDGLAVNMDALADAKTAMMKAKLGFVADVALNVFTLEQRKPGLRCMRKMMRRMRGHRRGGRGHHRRGMRPHGPNFEA